MRLINIIFLLVNLMDYNKLSYYHLVEFYYDELIKILNGLSASDVLSMQDRKRLSKCGILIFVIPERGHWNLPSRVLYPSCLTSMILNKLFDEYDFME